MKIVVLTNGSQHGLRIIKELKKNDLKIHAIILEKKTFGKKEENEFRRKLGSFSFIINLIPFKNVLYKWFRKYKYADVTKDQLLKFSENVIMVDNFNGETCVNELRLISPDLIILGGSRIIKEYVLTIPKVGTLNAHPGILPDYRGVDVVKWALYNDESVGVTVHFVNSGIDTGDILLKRELIQPGFKGSFEEVKVKAEQLAAEMMAEVANKFIKKEPVQRISNNEAEGNYYKKMSSQKEKELIDKLKS